MEIFGTQFYGILTVFHSLAALALVISLIMGTAFTFFVSEQNWKHIRVTGAVVSISYLVTFLFGWAAYPLWRVNVRAKLFDTDLPIGTALFEIKEHLAALGAFAAIVLLILCFTKMAQAPSTRKTLYGGVFAIVTILATTVMLLGFAFSSLY